MKYKEWELEVPEAITADTLWRMKLYREALFLGDLAWQDANKVVEKGGSRWRINFIGLRAASVPM